MAARLARPTISAPSPSAAVLAFVLAAQAWAGSLQGQSVIVRMTAPGSGSYPVGYQVAAHVEFCIIDPNEHFYDAGTILLNDVPVATAAGGSSPGCEDFQSVDVTVTLEEGPNTLAARVTTFIGPSPAELYTTTEYASYVTPADPPAIDLTPHNGYNRNVGQCVAACFNTVTSYTTPAYWTLDASRAVTLFYSSGQVESRHTVQFTA